MRFVYKVTTPEREFTTRNARSAASVAHNWKGRGRDTAVYVVADNGTATVTEVPLAATVNETARRAVQLRRAAL